MSEVFWKRNKPDHEGVVWNDLRDREVDVKNWVVTYRNHYGAWHIMWNPMFNRKDQLINQATTSEEQLRNDLKLYYLLTKGET
jgi:poly(3-hydroxyalkanoate) synthetase